MGFGCKRVGSAALGSVSDFQQKLAKECSDMKAEKADCHSDDGKMNRVWGIVVPSYSITQNIYEWSAYQKNKHNNIKREQQKPLPDISDAIENAGHPNKQSSYHHQGIV